MRCHGLTSDRWRCNANAVGATGFCEEHGRAIIGEAKGGDGAHGVPPSVLDAVKHLLKSSNNRRMVPDDVKFDPPAWLKSSSTAVLVDRLLNDRDPIVRWCAAFVIRKRRDPATIEPLWEALRSDKIGLVRQQAAVALGKIGTVTVLGPLIEALWHDSDAGVRQACAIALGNLGYDLAAGDLAGVLEREEAAFVRWDCVLALGQLGGRELEPLLTDLARNERTDFLQRACSQALADIRRRK